MTGASALTDRDAQFAVNYLKEFADNILVAIRVFVDGAPTAPPTNEQLVSYASTFRMSFSWIALTLSKTVELWDAYGRFASVSVRDDMRAVKREIVDRGIVKFRDRTVAHLFNRDTREPFMPEHIRVEAMNIMREDMAGFFQWLGNPADVRNESVVGTLLRFRADILEKYPQTPITA